MELREFLDFNFKRIDSRTNRFYQYCNVSDNYFDFDAVKVKTLSPFFTSNNCQIKAAILIIVDSEPFSYLK